MRRNFSQCLKEVELDKLKEYQKLYEMLFEPSIEQKDDSEISIHDLFGQYFKYMWFRGTFLSLDEFDKQCGFKFSKNPTNFSIDNICAIGEYFWNMLIGYQGAFDSCNRGYELFQRQPVDIGFCLMHIRTLMEKLGCLMIDEDNFTTFIPQNAVAESVSKSSKYINEEVSKKIVNYNHFSMKGDIQEKKNTILQLANLLEPQKSKLKEIDNTFSSDLFYLLNNLNLRHNNIDSNSGKSYNKEVAEMSTKELEKWYDEVYQMCLLAFMRLEQQGRKIRIEELKSKIKI